MADKTISQLYADNPVTALAPGDLVPLVDVSGAVTGAARIDAWDSYATIATLLSNVATLQSQVAAFAAQSSIIGVNAATAISSDSITKLTDNYPALGTDTRNNGDSLTHINSWGVRNELPVTNKTSVVITTTSGSPNFTVTSGTLAATDTGRQIAVPSNTQVPAGTYMTFATSTTGTFRDASGTAVNATASGTGITTVISSPSATFSLLYKIAGNNFFQQDVAFPATGTGFTYLCDFDMTVTQRTSGTSHIAIAHWYIWNAGISNALTTPMQGYLVNPFAWLKDSSSSPDITTTRQLLEFGLTPQLKAPGVGAKLQSSMAMSNRKP